MAKLIKELAVVVGSYTKNGDTKKKYKNIGVMMQGDDGGQFLMLDRSFNPAGVPFKEGSDGVLISLFDPKPRDGQPAQEVSKPKQEDDIPF